MSDLSLSEVKGLKPTFAAYLAKQEEQPVSYLD